MSAKNASRVIKAGDPRAQAARRAGEPAPRSLDGASPLVASEGPRGGPGSSDREAERLLTEARAEAERLRAQAIAEGRERGLQAVTELLAQARVQAARAQREAEGELRALGVRIAEKLLGRELQLSPDAVVDLATQALARAGAPRELTFRVHPDDLEALERGRPRLLERCRSASGIALRPDPSVGRGGCIVESELGVVDARLQTQLEALERALRGAV